MKKMIIAAATALSFAMGPVAFADDDSWSAFWNGHPPTTDANYSWVTASFAGGSSAQGSYNGNTPLYNNGGTSGSFNIESWTEASSIEPGRNNDTWAGLVGNVSGTIAPDEAGAGGVLETGVTGYSAAWQDGADAKAVTFQFAGVSTENDANGWAVMDGGAFADFHTQQPGYTSGHFEQSGAAVGTMPWNLFN